MSHIMPSFEFGEKFSDFAADLAEWSQNTFGSDADRDGVGALMHLELEVREALDAAHGPPEELLEELADCFILIIDASRRFGFKPMKLLDAAIEKLEKNKQRKWPPPDGGPIRPMEHLKD